jgi:hypothetical protein
MMFDQLYENLGDILEEHSLAEEAVDPLRGYTVHRDYYRSQSIYDNGAHLFLFLGNFSPGRYSKSQFEYGVAYHIDAVVVASNTSTEDGERAAGLRLRYLIHQIFNAIHSYDQSSDLRLPVGSMKSKPFPRIEPFLPEGQQTERAILGARFTYDFDLSLEPLLAIGAPLESISVDASMWKAIYS